MHELSNVLVIVIGIFLIFLGVLSILMPLFVWQIKKGVNKINNNIVLLTDIIIEKEV